MGKIVVFTMSEEEEHILLDFQEYLKGKGSYADISSVQGTTLVFSNLEIDLYNREIRKGRRSVKFTNLEFRLLHYLACQPGYVFTYRQIYEGVWEEEYAHEKGIIMTHIRHIRQKLESEGDSFNYIENIRGVGYRFKKPVGLSGND